MTDVVGPYKLAQMIDQGGTGVAWRATDTRTDRPVVIKLLADEVLDGPGQRERFRREIEVAASVMHPHILPMWDFSVERQPYIVMPFVEDGVDLAAILRNGPVEPERAVILVGQVASALDAVHRAGLVYRNVKPSNILVRREGDEERILLVDWGFTQPVGDSRPVGESFYRVGALAYAAPEVLALARVDHRTDVYALAVVLYECLAGQSPYGGETMAVIAGHMARVPPPLPDQIPLALRDVVSKGLAKNPDDRWQSAGALAQAAREALGGPRRRLRKDPSVHSVTELTVYTSNDEGEPLRDALVEMLKVAGFEIVHRDKPMRGSWFQRLFVRPRDPAALRKFGQLAEEAVRAAQLKYINSPRSENDEREANAIARLAEAMNNVDDAVVCTSSILFIKTGGKLVSRVLTEAEIRKLQSDPELMRAPQELLRALSAAADPAPASAALPVASQACPTCGHQSVDTQDRWQQHRDLTIIWLSLDSNDPTQLIERRHCQHCQPHKPNYTVVCGLCGCGPVISGSLAARTTNGTPPEVVLAWLRTKGWHEQPATGLICGDHGPDVQ